VEGRRAKWTISAIRVVQEAGYGVLWGWLPTRRFKVDEWGGGRVLKKEREFGGDVMHPGGKEKKKEVPRV